MAAVGDSDPNPDAAEPPAARYELVAGLPSRRLHDQVIVFDPATNTIHELRGAGADLHEGLATAGGPTSARELFHLLGQPEGGDAATVAQFLDQLVDLGVAHRER